MKTSPRIIKVLKIAGPLTLSAVLVWWLFRRVDFQRVGAVIRDDTHFMWLIAVMGIVTLSHVIRGIRWGYQLRGALEGAREGKTVEEVMHDATQVLTKDQVMPGVADMITLLQVEAVFTDGSRLISIHHPIK